MKGQLSSSTSYDSGTGQWTEAVTGYNAAYEPTGTSTTVPSSAGFGSAPFTTSSSYDRLTGLLESTSYSADGGLPPETVGYAYDLQGLPVSSGGASAYLDSVSYTPFGQVSRATVGLRGVEMLRTYDWDAGTGRLTASAVNLQTTSPGWADPSSAADTFSYSYDPAGLVTAAGDAQNGGASQLQCFSYNDLGQLGTAWTSTGGTQTSVTSPAPGGVGGCTDGSASASAVGGAAPYWESWLYNAAGDRTKETVHDLSGNTASDVIQKFTYPAAGSGSGIQPADAPSQVVTTGPGGSVVTAASYDGAGDTQGQQNTVSGTAPVPVPPAVSGVTYTVTGLVASVAAGGGTSSFTYGAGGDLMLEQDPSGSVLYLDGGAEELLKSSSGTVSGLRFYTSPDGSTVVRSSGGAISYEAAGQLGTAVESVDASSMTLTRRYYDPFGNPVGPVPGSWPDNKGFAGRPFDQATGLGLLGARQYDPVTGGFLSPDPVFQPGTLAAGGYAYTGDNPATYADPTGMMECLGGACSPGGSGTTTTTSGGGAVGGSGGGGGGCQGPRVFCHHRSDPAYNAWHNPLNVLAGAGATIAGLGDMVECGNPALVLVCVNSALSGNLPSQVYTRWVASKGIDTSFASGPYGFGEITSGILLAMLTGGVGAEAEAASLAPEVAASRTAAGFEADSSGAVSDVRGLGRQDNQVVLSGHGYLKPGAGEVTVPEGTCIAMYCAHGETIWDSVGNQIETGAPGLTPVEVFGPGESLPNYTLHPPVGLRIGGNPITVSQPTPLSELLRPNMGTCNWAACREVLP